MRKRQTNEKIKQKRHTRTPTHGLAKRELTTTATTTGTSLNKRFNEQNNGCARALYISLPSSAKQQREMTNSALSEERELRQLFFEHSILNLLRCPRFSFVIALTVINKVNDLRVSRDSLVKYKFIRFLIDVVLGVAVVAS